MLAFAARCQTMVSSTGHRRPVLNPQIVLTRSPHVHINLVVLQDNGKLATGLLLPVGQRLTGPQIETSTVRSGHSTVSPSTRPSDNVRLILRADVTNGEERSVHVEHSNRRVVCPPHLARI